ncbi:MAG TPA: UDP-N-acetylmuramoyl-tripeptide--D-alanyl-D-alanine ligase [Actinobacteria bacterium]|nr:UDP-N-acetylmuramoyl-tripeptide--D-alanyl-D-alanine ligase [Actinomycetota bacterium]
MLEIRISELLSILPKGKLIRGSGHDLIFSVCTDTRILKKDDFFVPLKGEYFDGHKFINEAIKGGASGFFTECWNDEIESEVGYLAENLIVIKVDNSLKALQSMASVVRKKLNAKVVGITGSTGKTTTKDMLRSILERKTTLVSTEKSYNNEIGVPLTILKADLDTNIMVLEMGMRGRGQIAELCEIAKPNIALITNIGKTHFELLRSEKAIAETKAELIESITDDGVVILNQDDNWTDRFKKMTLAKVVTYGLSEKADMRAENINVKRSGCPSFKITNKDDVIFVTLPLPGKHNIYNALAAASAAIEVGLSLNDVKMGLEKCSISEMRMQVIVNSKEVMIINDAYNANPDSMRASLESLKDIKNGSRKIAILGDMSELGELSVSLHETVGALVKENEVDLLFVVGTKAKQIAKGAIRAGMDESNIFIYNEFGGVEQKIKETIRSGDIVLVKASRVMALEKLVESIK